MGPLFAQGISAAVMLKNFCKELVRKLSSMLNNCKIDVTTVNSNCVDLHKSTNKIISLQFDLQMTLI